MPSTETTEIAARELIYKTSLLRVVLYLVMLAALALGLWRLTINPFSASVHFCILLICISCLWLLKYRPQAIERIAALTLVSVFLVLAAVYLFLHDNSARIVWYFPFMASVFFLKGKRMGLRWLLATMAVVFAGYALPWFDVQYSMFEIFSLDLALVMLYSVLLGFERVRQEQLAREREHVLQRALDARWRVALEGVGDAVWEWEIRPDRFIASHSYAAMLGYGEDEIGGSMLQQQALLHPDDRENVPCQLAQYLDALDNQPYRAEKRMRCKDGSYKWILCRGTVTRRDADGRPLHMMGTHVDISLNKEQERQLEHIAHFDALTGVPNRVLLADRMAQALARTRREHGLMAVCYLDLDGFKPVNDRYGHEVGDQVLVEVTRRIRACIRADDSVARLGGDEFVVLLVGLQVLEECVGSLHRLLEAISQPILLQGKTIRISASIGVSLYPEDDQEADILLRHADQAMYIAKQSGKNRYHLFDAANDQRVRVHHGILQEIRHGLEHGEFELYYQPKVELATRHMVGAEALIRWHHPRRGLLLPGDFLRAIENTELEIELGDWVVASACAQLRLWQAGGLNLEVSVNIAPYHLKSPQFIDTLQTALQNCPAAEGRRPLQIEVLESVALEDIAQLAEVIRRCRAFGVSFALDDFGVGYSPLTSLSRLEVEALKIDQSFVRGMLQERGNHAIVQGIVALARAFDRTVVAEGIEQEAQIQALRQMGCQLGQGNGISPPLPAAQLQAWSATYSG